jgi:hypothetical protein
MKPHNSFMANLCFGGYNEEKWKVSKPVTRSAQAVLKPTAKNKISLLYARYGKRSYVTLERTASHRLLSE